MRTQLSAILLCAASTWAVAQTEGQLAYNTKVKEAFDLYEKKQFLGSAQAYAEAFKAIGGKVSQNDRYNAACSWAMASVPDPAFFNLFRIAENMDYANLDHIQRDTDLNSLHADGRWPQLIDLEKPTRSGWKRTSINRW